LMILLFAVANPKQLVSPICPGIASDKDWAE